MRFALFCVLTPALAAQTWVVQMSGNTASLRGVSVVNAQVVWASGSDGTFLRTKNGGKTWTSRVVPNAKAEDFRGVQAFTANSAVLMASGEGAQSAIYSTASAGADWSLTFSNYDEKGFFDGLIATGMGGGMLLGDPVNGMFTLFQLDERWTVRGARMTVPKALPDEGAFAASNSSLAIRSSHIWFATGGKSGARVFRSDDSGAHWSVAKTGMGGGEDGSGIFSLAFRDDQHGVAVGGTYTKPKDQNHNIAVTSDGGATWTGLTSDRPRGYRSAVAWLPKVNLWITTGPTGSEYSRDGLTWTAFDDGAFNAIGVSPDGDCWAVGPKGRVAKFVVQAIQ